MLESDFSALLQSVLYTNQRQLSPESKKARLNSEVISIFSAFPVLPAQDSLYYELLALTAICGELPCVCADRLTSSKSYRKKVVTSLTHTTSSCASSPKIIFAAIGSVSVANIFCGSECQNDFSSICQAAPTPTPSSHPLPAVCGCIVSHKPTSR